MKLRSFNPLHIKGIFGSGAMVMSLCGFIRTRVFLAAIATMAGTAIATAPSARAAFMGDDSAQDPLVIDDFTQTLSVDTTATSSASDELTVNGKTVSRTLSINDPDGEPERSVIEDGRWRVTHNNFEGFAFDRDKVLVTSELTYATRSGESLDLAEFDRFRTTFNYVYDGFSVFDFTISLESGEKTASLLDSFSLGDTEPNTKTVAFFYADFENIDHVDLERITGIHLKTDLIGLTDIELSPISAVVPLPGALPLFLGGLAGVGYVVRRRQRQAAAA